MSINIRLFFPFAIHCQGHLEPPLATQTNGTKKRP